MVRFQQSLRRHCLGMSRNNTAKRTAHATGTAVELTGTKAMRNLRDVSLRACVLCGVLELYLSLHLRLYTGACLRSQAYVRGSSLSQQVCLISVALHAARSAVARKKKKTSYSHTVMSALLEANSTSPPTLLFTLSSDTGGGGTLCLRVVNETDAIDVPCTHKSTVSGENVASMFMSCYKCV